MSVALFIVSSMPRILMPAMHLPMPFAQLHPQFVALLRRQLPLRRRFWLSWSLLAQLMPQHLALMRRHTLATAVGKHRLDRERCPEHYRGQKQASSHDVHSAILCMELAIRLTCTGKGCNKP